MRSASASEATKGIEHRSIGASQEDAGRKAICGRLIRGRVSTRAAFLASHCAICDILGHPVSECEWGPHVGSRNSALLRGFRGCRRPDEPCLDSGISWETLGSDSGRGVSRLAVRTGEQRCVSGRLRRYQARRHHIFRSISLAHLRFGLPGFAFKRVHCGSGSSSRCIASRSASSSMQ